MLACPTVLHFTIAVLLCTYTHNNSNQHVMFSPQNFSITKYIVRTVQAWSEVIKNDRMFASVSLASSPTSSSSVSASCSYLSCLYTLSVGYVTCNTSTSMHTYMHMYVLNNPWPTIKKTLTNSSKSLLLNWQKI